MSANVPDEDEWVEAGLVPAPPEDPDEHRPAPPRPDLVGEAAEHDVIDQALPAPVADIDEDLEEE